MIPEVHLWSAFMDEDSEPNHFEPVAINTELACTNSKKIRNQLGLQKEH